MFENCRSCPLREIPLTYRIVNRAKSFNLVICSWYPTDSYLHQNHQLKSNQSWPLSAGFCNIFLLSVEWRLRGFYLISDPQPVRLSQLLQSQRNGHGLHHRSTGPFNVSELVTRKTFDSDCIFLTTTLINTYLVRTG